MTHRFPIKEIARQSGLGTATIDRVLNNRAHVSPQAALRVKAAIEELTAQETQLAARGRRLFFDFVIEAPDRFSREVRSAAMSVAPEVGTAVCRPRFLQQEIMTDAEVVAALRRILKRGSHGVCLKARDTVQIRAAVDRLTEADIPVITLVTDIAGTERLSYVGVDNAGAGRTAAYLIAKALAGQSGTILASRSHERFLGEEARETAFVNALSEQRPDLDIVTLHGGSGVPFQTCKVLNDVLGDLDKVSAVYSMGGGNASILERLAHFGKAPKVYIAHDLDRENRALIIDRRIDFVLHHDLSADLRRVFDGFLAYHRLISRPPVDPMSSVQVLTPENIPPMALPH